MKPDNMVSNTKCIIWLNEELNSMQSVVFTCYHKKALVSENAGFYWSDLDLSLVA